MTKRRRSMTLAEHDALLKEEGRYDAMVEAQRQRDEQVEAQAAELRLAEQPILRDLNAAGISVDSVWDLVNTSEPYPDALPILLDHLERGDYPDRVMESLGRALAVKPSVAWWERLKALYVTPRNSGQENGTAVALAACATNAQLDDLIGFLSLDAHGESRIYFLRPIKRLRGDAGRQLLESLRDDPNLGREATALLSRSR